MIGIIDYGMGNLRSVQKALQSVGAEAVIVQQPEAVATLDKLVLPGVGAFGDGMRYLRERGFDTAVLDFIATGRPMLGICLGMQLLFERSTEDASADGTEVAGLGVLPGRVVRFMEDQGPGQPRLKVPHMGWNQLDFDAGACNPLFAGLKPGLLPGLPGAGLLPGLSGGDNVYFVHSYYCEPANVSDVAARTNYGQPFCSAAWCDNVWATQFHPEKSQRVGLAILRNFAGIE